MKVYFHLSVATEISLHECCRLFTLNLISPTFAQLPALLSIIQHFPYYWFYLCFWFTNTVPQKKQCAFQKSHHIEPIPLSPTHMLVEITQQQRIPQNHPWLLLFPWKVSLPTERADLQGPFWNHSGILWFSASLFGKLQQASTWIFNSQGLISPEPGQVLVIPGLSWLSLEPFPLCELFLVYTFHNWWFRGVEVRMMPLILLWGATLCPDHPENPEKRLHSPKCKTLWFYKVWEQRQALFHSYL